MNTQRRRSLLVLTVGVVLAAGACRGTSTDATDAALSSADAAAKTAAPARAVYRDVTIPTGTTLPLALTSSVASDTSAVEDAVSARLTQAITIDGREVVSAGARVAGVVTDVNGSGRVKGRGMIAFRFTSLRTGNEQYELQAATLRHVAPATKGGDATKIGIGAGAGAVIGAFLGGKGGAAKGAAIGGGAGTGVVLATKGREMRLGPGADVTSRLTAPLTVRLRVS